MIAQFNDGRVNAAETVRLTVAELRREGYTEVSMLDIAHRLAWQTQDEPLTEQQIRRALSANFVHHSDGYYSSCPPIRTTRNPNWKPGTSYRSRNRH